MGHWHPELLAEYPKWGMGDSLLQLTHDSDPDTASTASHLLSLVDQVSQVNSALLSAMYDLPFL